MSDRGLAIADLDMDLVGQRVRDLCLRDLRVRGFLVRGLIVGDFLVRVFLVVAVVEWVGV